MSNEHTVTLQSSMHFLPTRLPIIVLWRVEEEFPAYREMMNGMYLLKGEVGSSSKRYATSIVDVNEANGREAERVLNVKEEEDEKPTTIPVIKTEPNNCMGFVDGETGSCSETCVTCDVDGSEEVSIKVEEAIDIKDETPETISFPPIKTENEGTLNEQLHLHSAKCRYSCDIRSGEHPYSCEVCNKAFSLKSSLVRHLRIHSGERPYTCGVCYKAFSYKSCLKVHHRIHSGERPYTCEECNKTFRNQSILIVHQRIHSGERPYTCEVCNKAFIDQSSLKRHQRVHSGERPYICEVCNKKFSDKRNVRLHQFMNGIRAGKCVIRN